MTRIGPRLAAAAVFFVFTAACGGSSGGTVATDVGITNDSILLGNTIDQSGPAKSYATIASAEQAYFTYINNQGGVNGRKIKFTVLDDGYNPAQTLPLTKQLVEQNQVFAIFGGLGTDPQTAVFPYLNQQKVPQLFVATGATKWGLDYSQHTWTLGWQPPYQGEAHIYAKDILANHKSAKIGVLYQNDDYGKDYLKGLTDGLGSNASMIVDKEAYDSTAPVSTLAAQLAKLKGSGADTLFIFAIPIPTITALATVTALGWSPLTYVNSVSNVASYMKFAMSKGAKVDGAISVGYIKDPTDPQWANDDGMKLYKTVIANCSTCDANNGFNIYGVAVAYTMVDVLKQAGSNLTRANIIRIASTDLNETNPFLLPGIKVTTTSSDHFPIMQEQVIQWSSGAWHLQGSIIDERGTIK
ncbi:MAG TPA: ABC transporter substrate-binding protein [Candidatus Dormibacteraeota bacterium]|nr:ABC transporter substrate-binding protein [Candidatus Dormibacteraeota bacterium]